MARVSCSVFAHRVTPVTTKSYTMKFKSGGTTCPSEFASIDDYTESCRDQPACRSELQNAEVESKQFLELTSEELALWSSIHTKYPSLSSPYYHPEFTAAVDTVRDDVEVAVVKNEREKIVAFFPFQRNGKFAEPIGGRLNDFHGLICDPNENIDLTHLCKSLDVNSFKYHALVDPNTQFNDYSYRVLDSHYIDLAQGFDAYHDWTKKHSSTIKRQPQKTRRLAREIGELRFEFNCNDREVLEQLIQLKRQKYQRTNTFDILSVDWAADTLREIFHRSTDNFSGTLSALWAGDKLIAAHFGMTNDRILHYWFPVFDPQYARYSPGTILMMESCKAAASRGINRVDLSYGDDQYKFKFANAASTVHAGFLTFSPLKQMIQRSRYETRLMLKKIPLKGHAKSVLRSIFPNFGGWNFR